MDRLRTFILSVLFLMPWVTQAGDSIQDDLVIYTSDSFIAPGGLGAEILPRFEKKWNCHVRALPSGAGGQLLTRLEIDAKRGKSIAQVVVGLDQATWGLAQSGPQSFIEKWRKWVPSGYSQLNTAVQIETVSNRSFLPYDYGVLALMADLDSLREMKLTAPQSVRELIQAQWKRNIILEDPRTSTPGLSFFLFTQKVLGNSVWDYWQKLRGQWLTMAPGWNGAYGLFLKKEAPLVWSYLTSQAYHEENGDRPDSKRRYQAILFQEGQPFQIEGAALIKGAFQTERQKFLAKEFLNFLISSDIQKLIPKKVWMLPARKDVDLPESFKRLPKPTRLIDTSLKADEIQNLLTRWGHVIYP